MKSFEVRQQIVASAEEVWKVLTTPAELLAAEVGIVQLDGVVELGGKLKLWVEDNPRAFALQVVEFEPSRRMVWSGGMPLGLFKGVRRYELNERDGATEFFMREEFSGLLLPLIGKSIGDLQPSFDKFGLALKTYVEGAHA